MLVTFFIAGAVIAPIAVSAIAQRGASQIEGSSEERVLFETAASMMLASHPLGVGANNFNYIAISEAYLARAGVGWSDSQATVHNVYWLTLAETGYLGLVAYVNLLLGPLIVALRCGVRHRRDIRGDLLMGLGVALLLVYLHSFEEWIFVTYRDQYVFVMDIGLIAGLAIQMGYWRFPRPSPRSLGEVRLAHGVARRRRFESADKPPSTRSVGATPSAAISILGAALIASFPRPERRRVVG